MTAPTAQPRNAGFTLIELMVVIVIISSLMIFLLPDLMSAGETARATDTEARILKLKMVIERYERKEGDFPPSSFSRLAKGVTHKADGSNEGIECLILATHQTTRTPSLADNMDWLGNTDGDETGGTVPGLNGAKKQYEVLDGWGNPFVYYHKSHYAKTQEVVMGGEEEGLGEQVLCKAIKVNGKYANLKKYQIISAGSDGVFNTDDDITYPKTIAGDEQ